MQNSDKILTRYRHHTCKFKHVCMCLYLFQKCRHHTGSIETQYCSGEIHIHTHSSTYMHILFCLYWIQTCMYPIQTCMYDVCMCMYFFAHTYKISQLLCCLYVLKNTYKYKHAGSLMLSLSTSLVCACVRGSLLTPSLPHWQALLRPHPHTPTPPH